MEVRRRKSRPSQILRAGHSSIYQFFICFCASRYYLFCTKKIVSPQTLETKERENFVWEREYTEKEESLESSSKNDSTVQGQESSQGTKASESHDPSLFRQNRVRRLGMTPSSR